MLGKMQNRFYAFQFWLIVFHVKKSVYLFQTEEAHTVSS